MYIVQCPPYSSVDLARHLTDRVYNTYLQAQRNAVEAGVAYRRVVAHKGGDR